MKSLQPRQPIADGVDLRILPLGDSITWGEGSSDGNGYRLALATLIERDGNGLQYIGRVRSGTMSKNRHEGHGGFQIGPVGATGKPDYPDQPNVVLLMAGTNDLIFHNDVENAPKRLGSLIGEINTACPHAAVLVGTLLPLIHPKANSELSSKETDAFNSAMTTVVDKVATEGKQVALIDMGRVNTSHIHTNDGIHPTDEGYSLIAAAWHDGLVAAGKKGWIQEPSPEQPAGHIESESIADGKTLIDNHVIQTSVERTPQRTWRLEQLLVSGLILVGLLWVARKAANIFLRG